MSIRSNIAWLALGSALMSGAAFAAGPADRDPRHNHDKPSRDRHDRSTTPQPAGPAAGVPQDGTGATAPATGAAAMPTAAWQQLGCMMFMPPEGVPTPGPMLIRLTNETAAALPAGTVIWMGPPTPTLSSGVIMPSRGINADGTPAHMDRYVKLPVDLAAGGSFSPAYSPSPTWPGCTAVIGMTSLIPAVVFVQ